MKTLILILILTLGVPLIASDQRECVNYLGGGDPFPLGKKAYIPWSELESEYFNHPDFSNVYFKFSPYDPSANSSGKFVFVSVYSAYTGNELGSGRSFVESYEKDLWARVKGDYFDSLIRLRAFYKKDDFSCSDKALVLTVKDYRKSTCMDVMTLQRFEPPAWHYK